MQIDFTKISKIISENNSFLITSHLNPDADAIGSSLAFLYLIKGLGKKGKIINYSPTPYYLEFLDVHNEIEIFNTEKHKDDFENFDVLVALDFQQLSRIGEMQDYFRRSSKIKLCIDHHEFPENFTEYLFIDTSYASTGEMIFDLIKNINLSIDSNIAQALYAAIMTDTGSFRFDRTTSKTHLRVAELLETGINPNTIYRNIYDSGKIEKLRLLGKCLLSLKFNSTKQIAFMEIHQQDLLEFGISEADTEGFVNYCLSIQNVKAGLLFFETKEGFKVSLRSIGNLPVNKVAKVFGGGGHMNAAGIRISNSKIEEYQDKIISEIEKYLNEGEL